MPQWPTTPQINEGKALVCDECDEITANPRARDFDPCPECGSDMTHTAQVTACPAEDTASCHDEEHLYRLCVHVKDDQSW